MSNLIPPSFTEGDAELREGKQLALGHTAQTRAQESHCEICNLSPAPLTAHTWCVHAERPLCKEASSPRETWQEGRGME